MTNQRLLDRQVALLDYLTSGDAIFGIDHAMQPNSRLDGFDIGRLWLEARFSYEKRMRKIAAVFSRTWEYLGPNHTRFLHQFVDTCPPDSIGRIDNAQQFYDFLCKEWRRAPPEPPFLPDVAAYELAYAKARSDETEGKPEYDGPRPATQRRRNVQLLICGYDIRSIYEENDVTAFPAIGEIYLAMAPARKGEGPRVFELPRPLFDLLDTLERWTILSEFGRNPETRAFLSHLEELGLLEIVR